MKNQKPTFTFPVFLIILFCLFQYNNLGAQSIWNKDIVDDAASGIVSITSSIVSDSFTPMTHYKDDDWMVSAVPAYFKIQKVFDDPEITGDDLKGRALGFGGGIALSERWMAYAIFTGMDIKGKMNGKAPGTIIYDTFSIDTKFSLYTLLAGFGFDLIEDNKYWSIPVYFGAYIQKYSADLKITPGNPQPLFSPDLDVTGEDMLYGYTGCIAISGNIAGMFRITPYYLYINSINKTKLTGKFTEEITFPVATTLSHEEDLDVSRTGGGMIGLRAAFIPSTSWSVSAGLGSLLTSKTKVYNKKYANGMEFTSFVLAFTFTGNFTGKDNASN